MNIFKRIKAVLQYIVSTPYYLYTKYTAYKQRNREHSINELINNKKGIDVYQQELAKLNTYDTYLKASITSCDELKNIIPIMESGEHKSYSIYMKSYVQENLNMLQKYITELVNMDIKYLRNTRDKLVIEYTNRISVQNSYILSCVDTVKDVDTSTNEDFTSSSNIQLKETLVVPLNEEHQVNQSKIDQLNIELKDIQTKLQDEVLKNTELTKEALRVKTALNNRITELEVEIGHNNRNYDTLEKKYDALVAEYDKKDKDKEKLDTARDDDILRSKISRIASLENTNLNLSEEANKLRTLLENKEKDTHNQVTKLTKNLREAEDAITDLEYEVEITRNDYDELLLENTEYENTNRELMMIMNHLTDGKMTYIGNTIDLLHTIYKELEAFRNNYMAKDELIHVVYSNVADNVVKLGELNKKQGELESSVLMYSDEMQKYEELIRLESSNGNSTAAAIHTTSYNTANGRLTIHRDEATSNTNNIKAITNTISDNITLLKTQEAQLLSRAFHLDKNLADIRKLLSRLGMDSQVPNKDEKEDDKATPSHHGFTLNDIATANREFIANAKDEEEKKKALNDKMLKSIEPSWMSTRRQDRSITESSSIPSTSSSKSVILNLNKNDSSPLTGSQLHKKDVPRVSSIKKKDDTALLNISREISSGQSNNFATAIDTTAKGKITGSNEEFID
jgi:hypothetical protein